MIVKRDNSRSIESEIRQKFIYNFKIALIICFLFLNNTHKFTSALAIMTTVVAVQTPLASAQPETLGNPIPGNPHDFSPGPPIPSCIADFHRGPPNDNIKGLQNYWV